MRLFSKILSILVFIWCLCNGVSAFLDFNNPENFMYTKTENTIFLDEYQVKSKNYRYPVNFLILIYYIKFVKHKQKNNNFKFIFL